MISPDHLIAMLSGLLSLLVLVVLGAPVFIALLVIVMLWIIIWFGLDGGVLLINSIIETSTTGALTAVPLFLLMGEILFRTGTVNGLVQSVDRLFGNLAGRQYYLSIIMSVVFGALSGSAVAVTAMLGRTMLPRMLADGYDERLSVGTILAGASLAPIIPPSILVILVGSMAGQPIARLLVAGIIPGLLIALLCVVYIAVRTCISSSIPEHDTNETARPTLSTGTAWMNLLLVGLAIGVVLGLIVLGIATPSESAAIGVLAAMGLALHFRGLTIASLTAAIKSTVSITAVLFVILTMAKVFGQMLAYSGATQFLVNYVQTLGLSPLMMFVALMFIPLIVCMFIDQVAFALVIIPIYIPLIKTFGYDPTWFWMLLLINLQLGGFTPPFGYTLFALQSTQQRLTTGALYSGAWPFVLLYIAAMAMMTLFPQIVTWLPSMVYG